MIIKKLRYADESMFGDGSDGNVVISANTALSVAEDTGIILKQYKSLTVNSSRSLSAASRCNAMILLVQGDLTINGTITMDKKASFVNDGQSAALAEPHISFMRNKCFSATGKYPVGGKGGNGGRASRYSASYAGTGGAGHNEGGGMGGGGAAYKNSYDGSVSPTNGGAGTRPTHGQTFPVTPTAWSSTYGAGGSLGSGYLGGLGPGGSGAWIGAREVSQSTYEYTKYPGNDGDAYGGGAIYIIVGGNVFIGNSGKITANGGNGANGGFNGGASANSGYNSGGGAGGGIICIMHKGTYTNNGTVTAAGGSAGSVYNESTSPAYYGRGTNGTDGTVFVTNYI